MELHGGLRLAPDGQRIALGLIEAGHPPDIWIHDLMRGSFSRLTHGPASNFNPIWTPDGKHLLYTSERPLFEISASLRTGAGPRKLFSLAPTTSIPFLFRPMARHYCSLRMIPTPNQISGWRLCSSCCCS